MHNQLKARNNITYVLKGHIVKCHVISCYIREALGVEYREKNCMKKNLTEVMLPIVDVLSHNSVYFKQITRTVICWKPGNPKLTHASFS